MMKRLRIRVTAFAGRSPLASAASRTTPEQLRDGVTSVYNYSGPVITVTDSSKCLG